MCPNDFQISRVQNEHLYRQYTAQKRRVANEVQNPNVQIVRQLWHGTDKNTADIIYKSEFNRSYAGKAVG